MNTQTQTQHAHTPTCVQPDLSITLYLSSSICTQQNLCTVWFVHNSTCPVLFVHSKTCVQSDLSIILPVLFYLYTAKPVYTGVALTFEKLRIANAQHGKNCVSSPAAKTTISTDLPKICPGHDRAGLQTAHRPFWLRHQQYVGTSTPSPRCDGEGRGEGAG